jgi:[ribosomal protein S5]-alanine N-acetyltransferase
MKMIDNVSIFGFRIKPLHLGDVSEKYLQWFQDPEVTRFLEVNKDKNDVSSLNDLIDYIKTFHDQNHHYLFGIFDEVENKHVGNITINSISFVRGTFDIGYVIGDKDYWGSRAGEAGVTSGLRFAFDELGLRKIFGSIYSTNLPARFLSKKIGFIEEARLTDRGFVDGKLDDAIIFTISNERWDELKKKYDFKY